MPGFRIGAGTLLALFVVATVSTSPSRQAFFETASFDWLAGLRAQFPAIRAEAEKVLEGYQYLRWSAPNLYQTSQAGCQGQRATFYLQVYEYPIPCNRARCPVASSATAAIPGLVTAGVYLLDAHSRILPHTGATNAVLRGHMGLICPPGCYLRAGDEKREWAEGEFLVFDDTIEHEAWNETDQPRAILMFDFFPPHFAEPQRPAAIQALRSQFLGARDYLCLQASGCENVPGEFSEQNLQHMRAQVAGHGLYFA